MNRPYAVVVTLILLCGVASAQTIRLKSGVSITADKITTKGDVVEYVVGATTYHVMKSEVERIDPSASFGVSLGAGAPTKPSGSGPSASVAGSAGGVRPGGHSAIPAKELSRNLHSPEPTVPNEAAMLSRILNMDKVDEHALGKIESEGNPQNSTAAYVVAARFEIQQNDMNKALVYARRALEFAPRSIPLLCWYSLIALQVGQNAEAISHAERAVQLAPQSPDALRILGFAYYESNRVGDAVHLWKRAVQREPDEFTQSYLEKAEREEAVEDSFNEQGTAHFTLRYQGRQSGFGLGSDLLHTLERQYRELSRELGSEPQSGLTVILYTEKEFFDVTEAPSWAGGLNDGKLRIPVMNVSGMTPELERVLKHELSHSFVHFITRGRCPRWVDEGIAQMMEPRNTVRYGPVLAELFREGNQAPLKYLEGSFGGLSSEQAMVGYLESLAAVEYIRSAYGMRGVQKMLATLAEGERGEDAVRAVTQKNYSQLEVEIGRYLAKTYEGQ